MRFLILSTEKRSFRPWPQKIDVTTITSPDLSGKDGAGGYKAGRLGEPCPDIRSSGPVRRPERHIRTARQGKPPEGGRLDVFDKRYWPGESFGDQLGFALRHEDLDLLVLKRLFESVPQDTVTEPFVRSPLPACPTGAPGFSMNSSPAGRLIFPMRTGAAVIDLARSERLYFTGTPRLSSRHQVRDNLLAHRRFAR